MAVTTNIWQNVAGNPAVPQFAEIVVRGSSVESDGGNKPFLNIFHFVRVSGSAPEFESDLATQFFNTIAAALSAALSVAYVPASQTCRFMDSPTNLGTSGVNPITGAVTGDRLPNFNAVVIRKGTWGRGRSYRGSNHYGPIAESQTLLDNLTAGGLALWQTVETVLEAMGNTGLTTGGGSVWKLCVISPTLSNLTANPIICTGSLVLDCTTNKRLGTMKRRKDKTGPSS